MKQIPLTQGYAALVDDADYEVLSSFKWHANVFHHTVYADRFGPWVGGKRVRIRMHRAILGVTDPTIHVDHVDHNGLNNQRSNLRPCTQSQNQANCQLRKDNGSGIKGASWCRTREAWLSQIRRDGKTIHLGYFPAKEAAGEAYAAAAKKYFGEFALPAKVAI